MIKDIYNMRYKEINIKDQCFNDDEFLNGFKFQNHLLIEVTTALIHINQQIY